MVIVIIVVIYYKKMHVLQRSNPHFSQVDSQCLQASNPIRLWSASLSSHLGQQM